MRQPWRWSTAEARIQFQAWDHPYDVGATKSIKKQPHQEAGMTVSTSPLSKPRLRSHPVQKTTSPQVEDAAPGLILNPSTLH